jgi:glutamate synthase (NADPH/NADH) small chain
MSVLYSESEAFIMDNERRKQGDLIPVGAPTGRKVAVIGLSSAGFGCSETLVQKGHEVTIFGLKPDMNGGTVHGISQSRPARDALKGKWEKFERAGVKFVFNNSIDDHQTIDSFFDEGFDAVFIDVAPGIMENDAPGANLSGVYKAEDFLIRAKGPFENKRDAFEIGQRVVVIGGGDKTSKCLETALELGSEDVTCLCRYEEGRTPVERNGQTLARVEGAKYRFLTQPVKFIAGANGKLAAVECIELKPCEVDAQGHRELVPVEGSNFSVAADTIVLSLPASVIEKIMADRTSGATLRKGVFLVEENAQDSNATVGAMKSGRKTALAIDKYLCGK